MLLFFFSQLFLSLGIYVCHWIIKWGATFSRIALSSSFLVVAVWGCFLEVTTEGRLWLGTHQQWFNFACLESLPARYLRCLTHANLHWHYFLLSIQDDDYICMAQKVDQNEMYITEFRVEGTAEKAHHLILYGCDIAEQDKIPWYTNYSSHFPFILPQLLQILSCYRDCGHHGVCKGQTSILFAWAKNAPKTSLPPSVGFRVGGRSNVKYYILQIHYAHPLPAGEKDHSGIDISITSQEYCSCI